MKFGPYVREFCAFVTLGSNAHKETSAAEDTEAKTAPAPKSEERTFDELLLSEAERIEVFKYIKELRVSGALRCTASKTHLTKKSLKQR